MNTAKRWHEVKGKWLYGDKKLTAIKAIHQHCSMECLQSAQQARKCDNRECRFWGFREGHNPNVSNKTIVKRNVASGKIVALNKAEKSNPVDVSKKIMTLDGREYELTPIVKQKEKK